MSFSAGFARGAAAVTAMQRTKLARDAQTENNRRWGIVNEREEADRKRRIESEDAARGLQEWENFTEAAMSNPAFQTDGEFDIHKASQDHTFQTAFADMVNKDPRLRAQLKRRAPGASHEVDSFAGLVPGDPGYVAMMVNVKDEEGNVQTRPVTENRSADPNDDVLQFTGAEMYDMVRGAYGGHGQVKSFDMRDAELDVYRGKETATQPPSALSDAQSTTPQAQGTTPPAPGTQLEAGPQEAPPPVAEEPPAEVPQESMPYDAETSEEAPPQVLTEPALEKPVRPKGRVSRKRMRQYREAKAAWDAQQPQKEPVVKRNTGRDQLARLRKQRDAAPEGSVKKQRAQVQLDEEEMKNDPEVQAQPEPGDVRVADVATKDKAAKAAEALPEPTASQAVADLGQLSIPTKPSVRSGKPSSRQLLAALRLQKQGLLGPEDVSHYARTGKLPGADGDWQIVQNAAGIFRIDKNSGSFQVIQDLTGIKDADEMFKRRQQAIEKANGMLKEKDIIPLDFWRRTSEEALQLEERGISLAPEVLAQHPVLLGHLAEAYQQAVARDDPAGWFTDEVRGVVTDYFDKLKGPPESTVLYKGDRQIDIRDIMENSGMSEAQARQYAMNKGWGSPGRPFDRGAAPKTPADEAKRSLPTADTLLSRAQADSEAVGSDLVREIVEGEGTSDKQAKAKGFASGYDVPYSYGKYGRPHKPLSTMTIAEVKDYQRQQINKTKGTIPGTDKGTGAVGKYQVTQGTLKMVQDKLGFGDDETFSADLQDRIGVELLRKRGYDKWLAGEIDDKTFQKNLSLEWASVADPDTGKSHYGQATGTSLEELAEVMRR